MFSYNLALLPLARPEGHASKRIPRKSSRLLIKFGERYVVFCGATGGFRDESVLVNEMMGKG